MKKGLIVLLLWIGGKPFSIHGAENGNNENNYAIIAGAVGAFTTATTLICWYFHQSILKNKFSLEKLLLSRTIDRLQGSLRLQPVPDLPSGDDFANIRRRVLPQTLSWEERRQLFADEEPISYGEALLMQQSNSSPPPYDLGLYMQDVLSPYESLTVSSNGGLADDSSLDTFSIASARRGAPDSLSMGGGVSCEYLEGAEV